MREKVAAALRRQLAGLPEAARTGPLAVTALALATRMDAKETSERDLAALARELRLALVALEESAARGEQGDAVDELTQRRRARHAPG